MQFLFLTYAHTALHKENSRQWQWAYTGLCTACLKSTCHFSFYENFGKRGPIITFLSLL